MSDINNLQTSDSNVMSTSSSATQPLRFALIAAITRKNGLGVNGTLAWRLPKEMAHFRKVTSSLAGADTSADQLQNAVVMGRKTWESIPLKFRPLKGRINIVISRQDGLDAEQALGIKNSEDAYLVNSLTAAVDLLRSNRLSARLHRTFLIGGAQLYTQALQEHTDRNVSAPYTVDTLLITRIRQPAYENCDVFLPEFRTEKQIEQDTKDDDIVVQEMQEDSKALYKRVAAETFDAYVGEAVEHGVIDEKGTQYSLQMWQA